MVSYYVVVLAEMMQCGSSNEHSSGDLKHNPDTNKVNCRPLKPTTKVKFRSTKPSLVYHYNHKLNSDHIAYGCHFKSLVKMLLLLFYFINLTQVHNFTVSAQDIFTFRRLSVFTVSFTGILQVLMQILKRFVSSY